MDPSLTLSLHDTELISRSMRAVSYQEAKDGIFRYVENPLQEHGGLTDWDLSFMEYVEKHQNSKLLFCRYGKSLGVLFSPADHHGIWVRENEGHISKGILPDWAMTLLEGLAKSKGLA